ncbi:retron St85 family effector protein [Aeromonas dhakensis]|uniref:retron St85 family effector protein n=1 Tax=Aeromonas dhakensis TaxID=196024 RepID=UPI0012E01150|nr:retron St85 family effector protein [Aeromonas dhakensis]
MKSNEFEQLTEGFLMCLDYNKLRLKNIPNFIFLCGGETERIEPNEEKAKTLPRYSNPQYKSMRGALIDVIYNHPELSGKIKLAEEYNDWLEHGVVGNLVDLEIAIADMSGSIVLFLEAPGAYAELGSFCTNEQISQKLILIVNENINPGDEISYINLGPIKHLTDNEKRVLRYSWDIEYSVSGHNKDKIKPLISSAYNITLDKINLIAEQIAYETKLISVGEPKIDTSKLGHICFIIADLIKTFHALKINEINSFVMSYFDKKERSLKTIKACIYILKKFNLITESHNGDTYYIPTEENIGFIKYYFTSNIAEYTKEKSASDISNKLLTYYHEHDKFRYRAIFQ